jgi:hypothetical protein
MYEELILASCLGKVTSTFITRILLIVCVWKWGWRLRRRRTLKWLLETGRKRRGYNYLPHLTTNNSTFRHTWAGNIFKSKIVKLAVYLWALTAFSFSWSFYTVGRTPWTGDQPVAKPLPAHRTAQTYNKRTQTSMPQVGFQSTVPEFELAKTFHALDRAATVIGVKLCLCLIN